MPIGSLGLGECWPWTAGGGSVVGCEAEWAGGLPKWLCIPYALSLTLSAYVLLGSSGVRFGLA